jgi:SAM-dependent methyltransferase
LEDGTSGGLFGPLAPTYDRLRPADENWQELLDVLAHEADLRARRVLDVGCGTGRSAARLAEAHGARVWGVDPSPEMLEQARRRRAPGVGFKAGRAEELPFKDAWFERAIMWLVVHLVDRARAFGEVRRVLVPGGRFAVATFDPTHFDAYWLNRIFPSLEAIDRARFPTSDELERELRSAGFHPRLLRLTQHATLDRDSALERIRGRYISTLRLLPEPEYRTGLERAQDELPERIDYELEWLVAVGDAS